ncbi:hypothetical protein T01_13400 [Trichinella spiralis]|uniref:Uncharacterized protein n=1 Tax=Trichinella spiralis TaxID=6334 RepID=A0A0V1AZX5_TRISP|nr:hypothetical protein T01_13400 [Trichinella spiralis]
MPITLLQCSMTIPKQYQCGFDVFLAQLYPDMQCQVHVLNLAAPILVLKNLFGFEQIEILGFGLVTHI